MPSLRTIARLRPPSASAFASVVAVAALASIATGAAVVALLASHRPATAQSGADEPYAPGARETFIPILEALHADGSLCIGNVIVQNVGDEPSKGVAVFWGVAPAVDPSGPGPGPLKVECTGLIAPGTAWHMTGPMIPSGAQSAIIYSATVKTLSEIGVDLGFDDIVADYFCENLFFSIIGDEGDALRLRQAVRDGGEFAGMPMDRVLGAPLSVIVDRDCIDGITRYTGISNTDGLAADGDDAVFEYVSPSLPADLSILGSPSVAAMNVGYEYARVELVARGHGGDFDSAGGLTCPPREPCGSMLVAPGETAVISTKLLSCPDVDGSAWISSDQPLAVVVDGFGPAGRTSSVAQRVSASGSGPGPGPGIGSPGSDAVVFQLSAPLVYNEYQGWSTIVHVANSVNEEVRARLTVRSSKGELIDSLDFRLCALGSRSLSLGSDIAGVPPNFIGSISIEAAGSAIGGAGRDVLAATVELVRFYESGEPLSTAAYEILPAEPDDGLIGVPLLVRGAEAEPTSRLAIQNRARLPGFTDFVVYLFDSHGLLDYLCLKLNALEVEYIDFSTSRYISPGFKGSAIISAVYWEHDEFDERGDFVSNVVSLGVVALDSFGSGPASASMHPALDSELGVDYIAAPLCGLSPPSERETSYAFLPNVANGPLESAPVFPGVAP